MVSNEIGSMSVWLRIDQIGDIALLPQFDRFGFMCRNVRVAHRRKKVSQHLRFRMSKLDKLKTIGSGRILVTDR